MPGTWEVKVRVIPLEVTEEDRGQEKECGFYTKCTKCLWDVLSIIEFL